MCDFGGICDSFVKGGERVRTVCATSVSSPLFEADEDTAFFGVETAQTA